MSVGCGTVAVKLVSLQPCRVQLTLYARNILNAVRVAPPEDEQVMLQTCRAGHEISGLNPVDRSESLAPIFSSTDLMKKETENIPKYTKAIKVKAKCLLPN
jgi:hypothetical protein